MASHKLSVRDLKLPVARFASCHDIDAMRLKAARSRSLLLRKYDPNQPRVPAGHPGGGQWTSAGSGDPVDTRREVVRDSSGNETWESVVNTYRPDGALSERTVKNRDGSRILSQFNAGDRLVTWDERHTVILADGGKVSFENSDFTQTIYDAQGQRLAETVMTADGPEAQPIAQPASLAVIGRAAATAPRVLQGAATLYNWLSTLNGRDSTAVLAFRADVYSPVVGLVGATIWTGSLTDEQLQSACPAYPAVQGLTNSAASTIDPSDYKTPATYGTAVHTTLRDAIEATPDSGLLAEVSFLKTLHETGERPPSERPEVRYGAKGSIRVDVLEDTRTGTICVYDIKTGKSGLYPGRSAEIARTVYLRFPDTQRIIVTEVRPQR